MQKLIVLFILLAVTACSSGTQQVTVPTMTHAPPTATFAPTPTIAPTATLILFPVQLAMDGLTCPSETVSVGQQVFIRHLFQFGKKGFAKRIANEGEVKITIDGTLPGNDMSFTLADPKLWSAIEVVDKGALGKFDITTFEWDSFPFLPADTYRVDVSFGIPRLNLNRLFPFCGNLTVAPRK